MLTDYSESLPSPMLSISPNVSTIPLDIGISFFELFQRLESKYCTCFLLESAHGFEADSHFAYIGFDPDMIISARGNILTFETESEIQKVQVTNPYRYLQKIFPQNHIQKTFCGGLIGYLSTEAVNYVEPAVQLPESADFETFKFGFYTDGIVLDKKTGQTHYFYHQKNRAQDILNLLKNTVEIQSNLSVTAKGDNLSFEQHQQRVQEVLENVKAGNVFQCEVGLRSDYEIVGNKTILYKELIEKNPSPYMFYLKFNDEVVLGSSPEMLFTLKDDVMSTKPLAGTIKRGKNKKEDLEMQRKLLSDNKELAEHRMLIDMHRNDIGKTAQIGTVVVTKEMEIVSFEHVHHLMSEILGIIKNDHDMFDGFAGIFPGGVLNGAPKIESISIISKQEDQPRGVYGGAVGWFGFHGDCTFCIPIRSLFIKETKAYIQACSGIVLDSNPEAEYNEVQNKLASLRHILDHYAL